MTILGIGLVDVMGYLFPLTRAVETEYLETDEANAANVSAAYIDSAVNGTKYTTPEMSEQYEVHTFTIFLNFVCLTLKSKR